MAEVEPCGLSLRDLWLMRNNECAYAMHACPCHCHAITMIYMHTYMQLPLTTKDYNNTHDSYYYKVPYYFLCQTFGACVTVRLAGVTGQLLWCTELTRPN